MAKHNNVKSSNSDTQEWQEDVHSRLIRLETSHQATAESIHSLGRKIEQISKATNDALSDLRSAITESRRPQWNLYVTAAGVIFAVVGTIGAMSLSPLQIHVENQAKKIDSLSILAEQSVSRNATQEAKIETLEQDLTKHERLGDHPFGLMKTIESVKGDIKELRAGNEELYRNLDAITTDIDQLRNTSTRIESRINRFSDRGRINENE
jgi:chromosome segregation ATPase